MGHLSVQRKRGSFLLRSKTSTAYESSIGEKMHCLLSFLNEGSTVTFCYLFPSPLFISLNFPFICVLRFFFLLVLPFASIIRIIV
jgi:hypothetical protein